MPRETTRREVLAALGLGAAAVGMLGLSGCTSTAAPPPPDPVKSADEVEAASAAARESLLAERAAGTARKHPTLTSATDASQAHAAHAAALEDVARVVGGPSASGSPTTGPTLIPASRQRAATALANAELAVAEAHQQALVRTGVTGGLAALLASVAASDASFARSIAGQGRASG